jgi:serine/threonine protein kinase
MLYKIQIQLNLTDIVHDLHLPAISASSQGFVYKYGTEYVVKLRQSADPNWKEVTLLAAAEECAVDIVGSIQGPDGWNGFIMPLLKTIDAKSMTADEKIKIFHKMRDLLQILHKKGIIHGDIKLSNMLLDEAGNVKLCDFGTSAFMSETHYPVALSTRWCSPYRFRFPPQQPLIPAEDVYALGCAVWELFTGMCPYDDIEDDGVEEAILSGKLPDLDIIESPEAKAFIKECWGVFRNEDIIQGVSLEIVEELQSNDTSVTPTQNCLSSGIVSFSWIKLT